MKQKIQEDNDSLSKLLFPLIMILTSLFVFYLVHKVLIGDIAFWYDPARDMLSAWANLSKPTLIGPTSGIPGIFYGPYWIWLLSLGMLFSHDPRIVTFIVAVVPYLLIFPLILIFSRIFTRKTAFLMWILFILGYSTYAFSLWNPNPAPLILLIYIILLMSLRFDISTAKKCFVIIASGFGLGILLNFHLSLGIGVLFGTVIYFLDCFIYGMLQRRRSGLFSIPHYLLSLLLFALGFMVAFAPFLLFEIRHQFMQTRTLLATLSHYGGNIPLHGLTRTQIVESFFAPAGAILHLPTIVGMLVLIVIGVYTFYRNNKQINFFTLQDKKLVGILSTLSFGILFIYLTARNPIWSYHFIAVEILFLFLIGFLMQKIPVFRLLMTVWIFVLLVQFAFSFPRSFATNPQKISGDLAAEISVTRFIAHNAGSQNYTVYSYSPSIYMYEYSYLFRWLENKDFSYDPGKIRQEQIVYLILPPMLKQALSENFIHFRSSPAKYKTTSRWTMVDGSIIIKRQKIK